VLLAVSLRNGERREESEMSADNYVIVREYEGAYEVYEGSASADDPPWKYGLSPIYTADTATRALIWAHRYCRKHIVEYGVELAADVQEQLMWENP